MIPNNVKSKDLIGQYVITDRDIMNGAGIVIPKGTKVKIVGMGRSFDIQTEKCSDCGLSAYVRGVTRKEVRLLTSEDEIMELLNKRMEYGNLVTAYDGLVNNWCEEHGVDVGDIYSDYGCMLTTEPDMYKKLYLERIKGE